MGQSLAADAVSGINTKSYVPSAEALEALESGDIGGLLAANKARFGGFFMGPEDDGDDDADDDGDDDDDDADDDGDDDDDDDDNDQRSKSEKRIKELSDEAAKHRRDKMKYRKERDELQKKLQEKEDGGKPDDEKSAARLSELETANTELTDQLEALRIQMAFIGNSSYKWKNPKAALKLADLDDVEIDDDGTVHGMDEALKALAESDPYLLVDEKDDDDEDDDEGEKRTKRKAGSTGRPPGRRKSGKGDRSALLSKYPALGTR